MAFKEEVKMTKECPICEEQFTFTSKNPQQQKFCSRKCREKDYRDRKGKSEIDRVKAYQKTEEFKKRRKLIRQGKIIPQKRNVSKRPEQEVIKICLMCKKEFTKRSRNPWQIKYCSDKCSIKAEYQKKRESELKRVKKYRQTTQGKKTWNKYMRERDNTIEEKEKIRSRDNTWKLLKKEPHLLEKKCKVCSSTESLEIHHEIYPRTYQDIKDAIKNNKIYFLCRKHHYDYHKE